MIQILAIDPTGCKCENCLRGLHAALEDASEDEKAAALLGEIQDNTNGELENES